MATVIKVELVELKKWDNQYGGWRNLYAKRGVSEPVVINSVTLYSGAGIPSTISQNFTINWDSFISDGGTGYTIFGTGLTLLTEKSIRLRYKIKTTTTEQVPESTTTNFFYQIIKCAVGDTDAVTGFPSTTSGNIGFVATIRMPGIKNSMINGSGQDYTNVLSYLSTPGNWKCDFRLNGILQEVYTPGSATVGTIVESTEEEYGGFYVNVNLGFTIPISTSGNYTAEIHFQPNDGEYWQYIGFGSGVATITVINGQQASAIFSFDASSTIGITFTSAS